jgi:arylformamidase
MTNHLYDPVHLEREYFPWSDSQSILNNWTQRSASYLARANLVRNVQYGASPAEKLDIIKPLESNAPVLVFIHGGYWRWLDKDDYTFALEPLVTAGALVATINYPLCPEVSLDTLINRVRAACVWVWKNVRDYGGNPDHLHVTGHSAGGHLTAIMAATDWPTFQTGLPRDMIKSIIPVSGLFDLEPLRLISLNEGVRMDMESAKRNSPLFMTPTSTLAVTVVVGGEETNELRRQSREFSQAWMGKTRSLEFVESPGHNHFAVIEAMTEPNNLLTTTILRHLDLKMQH